MLRKLLLAVFFAGALACGNGGGDPAPTPTPALLSDYGLFVGDGSTQEPADGVVPYEPISPLFSDFAVKRRFLYVPDGATITYENEDLWEFPPGSILIKTFAYPADFRDPDSPLRLMETRLLIKQEPSEPETWTVHTFVWNDEQTEAVEQKAGKKVPVSWIDADGETVEITYRVPNTNQCLGCHGDHGLTHQLGPRTRQLNGDYDYGNGPENIIDHMDDLGLFDVSPPPAPQRPSLVDPYGTDDVVLRARSYLEANCSHCHNADMGFAASSGLYLDVDSTDPSLYGVCRTPSAAGGGSGGLTYDIVPGHPEESIMIYRMKSTDPEEKMPEMPALLPHPAGIELISEWIAGMTPEGCSLIVAKPNPGGR